MKLPEGSALTITDHRGIRLYRYPESDAAPPGTSLPEDSLREMLGTSEQGLIERRGQDGVYRIYAFKQLRLRDNGPPYLCMTVGIPKEPIVRMANQEMLRSLFLLGLLCLVAMALAWSFGQFVLARPIERLLVATHRLGGGNMGARTDLQHGSDELGRLAKSFDDMAALLEQRSREREEAEERLKKSEEKYRHIVEHSMEGIFQSTPDGRYLTVNPAFARMFGFESPQEMISEVRDIGEQLYRDPAERQRILERIQAEGHLLGFEAEVQKRNGETFWTSLNARCLRDSDGNVLYYDGFVTNITERKRTEAALRDQEQALRRAYAFSHSILKNASEGLCVCHEGPESPFMQFTIWNDRMVEITGFTVEEVNYRGWEQCLIADPVMRAKASKRLLKVYLGEDLQGAEGTIARADGSERAVSVSTSVVESDDGRLHILALVRDISEWTRAQEELQRHREHLEDLVRARTCDLEAVVEQLNQEVQQRKSAEATLRASEEKLRTFIEATSDWVWEIDGDGRFTYVSDKISTVLGYEPHEVLGASPWDFMPPEAANRASEEYPLYASCARPFLHIEHPHLHKDGHTVVLESSGVPLFDSNGTFSGYRGINRDISKRKTIEAQLRESEAKYRTLVEQIPAITYIVAMGEQFSTLYVSPQVEPMLGFTQEQSIHDRRLKSRIVHPEDRERLLAQLRQLKQDGGPFCAEYRLFDAHGTLKWIRDEARVVRDASGNPMFLHGVMLDISDRKRMEEALQYSENIYRTVFENTGTGMILIEEDTTISLVNAQYEKCLCRSKREIEGKRSWTDFVLKEDRERLKTYHSLRRTNPDLVPSQYEIRVINGKGRERDLLTTVSMIPGTKRSVASLQDITERKKTERALEQSVAELHNLQCITRKLLQLEELPSVMHAIAEGIVVNIGYDMALAARYVAEEQALTGFVLFPGELQGVMDQYLGGSPKGTLWDRKLKSVAGQNPVLDRVLNGETVIGDSLGPFISHWLSSSSAQEMQQHTGRKGYISLPMQVKGETVGVILAGWNGDGHNLASMRSALGRVADQAAVAVKSAGLFECVKSQRGELRALAAKLQNLQETERKLLSQELHDRVGQNLTGLSINLGLIRSTLSPGCLEQVQARIADSVSLVGSTMECVRDVMAELHPPGLSEYGLPTALKWYCDQLSKRTGMRLSLKSTENADRPDRECEIALFRIAQEALTNAVRHSQAREITVSLKSTAERLRLCIADDGMGFDVSAQSFLAEGGKLGLINMRERAEAAGGEIRVESAPGKGTRVVVGLRRLTS
ncbi:MAG: PAS domain S-box protein [Syntrophobacteraceae bacterium]